MSETYQQWREPLHDSRVGEAHLKALGYHESFDWEQLADDLSYDSDRKEHKCKKLIEFQRTTLHRSLEASACHFQQFLDEAHLDNDEDGSIDLEANILFSAGN